MFFDLKDLLHTTKRQDVLLGEQTRLQEDLQERRKKLEVCQKEEATKRQHLQALQTEMEANEAELARQETVPHPRARAGGHCHARSALPLGSEVEANESELARQETVPHLRTCVASKGGTATRGALFPWRGAAEKLPLAVSLTHTCPV